MNCPSCQATGRAGERRCMRCGQVLPPTCLACGEPVGEGEELCASCGTERMPLAPLDTDEIFRPTTAEETQVVTAPYPLTARTVGLAGPRNRLHQLFGRAREETVFAALVGPPGSGKSRLLAELRRGLAERAPDARVFAASAQGPLAYAPFAHVLAARFGLDASDGVERVQAKLAAGVADVLPDARQKLEARLFIAVRRFVAADAARGPIVLLLDDLEQAGAETINLLHYLAAGLGAAPVLLLAALRPTLFETHPAFGDGEAPVERIDVGPLSEDDAERLLRELLVYVGEPPVGLILHARRLGRTPRALVELARWCLEADVIRRDGPGWLLDPSRLARLTLP